MPHSRATEHTSRIMTTMDTSTTHINMHKLLEYFAGPDQFNMDDAVAFAYTAEGGVRELCRDKDVYGALRAAAFAPLLPGEDGVGCATTGWAAPLSKDGEPEGQPSEHPKRRRCQLVAVTDRELKGASIVTFEGEDAETFLSSDGTGQLTDAMHGAMRIMLMAEIARKKAPTEEAVSSESF